MEIAKFRKQLASECLISYNRKTLSDLCECKPGKFRILGKGLRMDLTHFLMNEAMNQVFL